MTNEGAGHAGQLNLITATFQLHLERERVFKFHRMYTSNLRRVWYNFDEKGQVHEDFTKTYFENKSVFEVPRSQWNVCVWSKILGLSGGTGNGLMRDGGRAGVIGG